MMDGQGDDKGRTIPWFAASRNLPAVPFHDSTTDRQAHPTALVLTAPREALEGLKDSLGIFLCKPDPLIFHKNL
jgi:hypothetical protein